MRLVLVRFPEESRAGTTTASSVVVLKLPEPDMVVDPRGFTSKGSEIKLMVTVDGTALTITRTTSNSPPEYDVRPGGWHTTEIRCRVYHRNEFRYSFQSTKYLFHGIDGERAPRDATEVFIKDGAETITEGAFENCVSLVKVTIPDTVKHIERAAFAKCESLHCIQLPPNLQKIGMGAFSSCLSLQAILVPPTVARIDHCAFHRCESLRIVHIPKSAQYDTIGDDVVAACYSLLTDQINNASNNPDDDNGDKEILRWLRNRYNPLHELCCDPFVSAEAIRQYIQGHHNDEQEERAKTNDKPQFTPLHLLAANPSVTGQLIASYLQLAPDVALFQDSIGMTPLHVLCSVPCFFDGTDGAIRAYLNCSEGKKAAFMKDYKGMTPLQYLCEDKYKSFDDLLFLKNKSFAGLMVWWYDCLDINLFTEDAKVNACLDMNLSRPSNNWSLSKLSVRTLVSNFLLNRSFHQGR